MSSETVSLPQLQALKRKQLEEQWKRDFELSSINLKKIQENISAIRQIQSVNVRNKEANEAVEAEKPSGLQVEWKYDKKDHFDLLYTYSEKTEKTQKHQSGGVIDKSGKWMKEKNIIIDENKQKQIQLLEYYKMREREYIAGAMKEALEQSGIVYSDMSENDKNYNQIQHYRIDEKGKIELQIENTESGEFLMEVVGRTAHPGNESDEEKRYIQEEAGKICTKYAEIKKRLEEKGIDIRFKFLKDPSIDPVRFEKTRSQERRMSTATKKEMKLDGI